VGLLSLKITLETIIISVEIATTSYRKTFNKSGNQLFLRNFIDVEVIFVPIIYIQLNKKCLNIKCFPTVAT
jgi:hypothetical protein